jgi:hypothetical protein
VKIAGKIRARQALPFSIKKQNGAMVEGYKKLRETVRKKIRFSSTKFGQLLTARSNTIGPNPEELIVAIESAGGGK